MNAITSLIRLRRSTIAWAFALTLVTLVVLPFTAPFSTFDFAELADEASHSGQLASGAKSVKALAVAVVLEPLTLLFSVSLPLVALKTQADGCQVLRPVLRI